MATTTSSRLRCVPAEAKALRQATLPVMPDDHSESVPPLPIPNRTVKRLSADDSAATSVKVGHRQALYRAPPPDSLAAPGVFACLRPLYYPTPQASGPAPSRNPPPAPASTSCAQ